MAAPVRFIGRRAELRVLHDALDQAKAGHGSVVLVSGELGIGKSRLVEEFSAYSLAECSELGAGRWYESREMPAYVGFREALLPLAKSQAVFDALDRSDPHLRELSRLGREFGEALGFDAETNGDSDDAQYNLWRGVGQLLDAAGRSGPAVITLDDLQWADAGSLGLLSFLGRTVARACVVVVGTYRAEDAPTGHPLHEAIAQLGRAEVLTPIHLEPLTRSEVGTLAGLVAGYPVARDVVDALNRQTRGNPLFVTEIVRHLTGKEALQAGAQSATGSVELEVPERLREVTAGRLERLSAACRELLSLAAALGRDFDAGLLESLSGLERDEVLAILDEAVEIAALRDAGRGMYSFGHPIMRSVAYNAMKPSERHRAHLRAAAALAVQPDAVNDSMSREIAAHLLAAGGLAEPDRAARYCLEGARQARRLFSFDEARDLLQGGLRNTERTKDGSTVLRAEMLNELGYAETALGHPDEGIARYRQALAAYEELGEAHHALDVRRWLAATLARHNRWPEVLEVSRDGLADAAEAQDPAYLGLAGSHAMALMVASEMDEAATWVDRLLRLAFDSGTRAVASHVDACWHAFAAGGDNERGLRAFEDAQRYFLEAGLDGTAAQVALDRTVVAYLLGRFETSDEARTEAWELATATGRVSVQADLHGIESLMQSHRGEWVEAARSRARREKISSSLGGGTVYTQLAERGAAFEEQLRAGPEQAKSFAQLEGPLRNEPFLALLQAQAGDKESASKVVDLAVAALPEDGRGLFWLGHALPIASTLCLLRRADVAERWVPALSRYRGCLFPFFVVDAVLAMIAAQRKQWDEASAYFADAEKLCERHGLKALLAAVAYQHGRLFLRHDRRKARETLGQAETLARELDAGYLESNVSRIIARPKRGRPPAEGPAGLTERERAVLRHLVQGKSNREIADELVIATSTVAAHLGSIYAKLGVGSRSAAIIRALDQGLAGQETGNN